MKVDVYLVVSDKGIRVVGGDGFSESEAQDAIECELRYNKATIVAIQKLEIDVPLLEPVAPKAVEEYKLEVPDDIRWLVETAQKNMTLLERDQDWDRFVSTMPPGDYRIVKGPGLRGIQRLADPARRKE